MHNPIYSLRNFVFRLLGAKEIIDGLYDAIHQQSQKINELEQLHVHSTCTISMYSKNCKDLRVERDSLRAELQESNDKVAKWQGKVCILEDNLAMLKRKVAENAPSATKYEEMKVMLTNARSEADFYKKRAQANIEQLEACKGRLADLEQACKNKERTIDELEKAVTATKSARFDMRDDLLNLQQQLELAQKVARDRLNEIEVLRKAKRQSDNLVRKYKVRWEKHIKPHASQEAKSPNPANLAQAHNEARVEEQLGALRAKREQEAQSTEMV